MKNYSLRIKLFYFVNYLGVGFHPFMALYLYRRAFPGWQIGLLLGSMPLAKILVQPIWSYLSDVLHTRKWLLVISCVGISISLFGIGLSKDFIAVFVWGIVSATLGAPLGPVSTALVLDYLERIRKPQDYALMRLWGSVSFSISSLILATLFLENILGVFTWILGGVYLILAVISLILPETTRPYKYSVIEGLRILPENPMLVVYLIGSIFVGASISVSENFLTLFLSSMNTLPLIVGLAISLQGILEIPLMLMVPMLSKRVSWSKLILLGALVLPIRWLIFLLIKDPLWILPTQLLHSIAIVSFMVVGVSFLDKRINNKWRATGQGLYTTAMGGIGSAIGLYLGGVIMERMGLRAVWGLNLIFGILGVLFIIIALNRYRSVGEVEETCQIM